MRRWPKYFLHYKNSSIYNICG